MSVTRTFTVTVVSTGSGNKYFIDGVQQDTLNLAEGGTFRFDQSDSSNGSGIGHPLRFSTTNDGTHSGGSEYTTGVTTNGTPGQAGAYTQIEVAASAPTLYYYCTNHSGMGGQANTISGDSYGAFGWNVNRWGVESAIVVGWGADSWNEPGTTWNDLGDVLLTPSGFAITSSLGSPTISAEINKGWGQDTWGNETWGQSGMLVELTGPDAIQSNVSANAWNDATWGRGQGWGIFSLAVADVMGLTGVSSTSGVGSVSHVISATFTLTGVSATSNVGGVTIGSSPVVNLSGQQATVSVGSIDPLAIVQGLTGQSVTSAVGSVTVADLVLGISGQSATVSVAGFGTSTGFGIQAYSDVDTGSNISYSDVATGSNITYSDVA